MTFQRSLCIQSALSIPPPSLTAATYCLGDSLPLETRERVAESVVPPPRKGQFGLRVSFGLAVHTREEFVSRDRMYCINHLGLRRV
jgi:hypothetical protein